MPRDGEDHHGDHDAPFRRRHRLETAFDRLTTFGQALPGNEHHDDDHEERQRLGQPDAGKPRVLITEVRHDVLGDRECERATTVTPNDVKRAIRHAASAGITRSVRPLGVRVGERREQQAADGCEHCGEYPARRRLEVR